MTSLPDPCCPMTKNTDFVERWDEKSSSPQMSFEEFKTTTVWIILAFDGYKYFLTDEAPGFFKTKYDADKKISELIEATKYVKREKCLYFAKSFGSKDYCLDRLQDKPIPKRLLNPSDYYDMY